MLIQRHLAGSLTLVLAFMTAASFSFGLSKIPEGYEQLGSPYLQGRVLKMDTDNFTMESPADDWIWIKSKTELRGTNYICYKPDSQEDVYIVTVVKNYPGESLDETVVNQFIQEFTNASTQKGHTFAKQVVTKTNVPLPDSYKVLLSHATTSVSKFDILIVGLAEHRLYVFQVFSKDTNPPVSYVEFLSSFQVLKSSITMHTPAVPKSQAKQPERTGLSSTVNEMLEKRDVTGAVAYTIGYLILPILLIIGIISIARKGRKAAAMPAPASAHGVQFSYYGPDGKIRTVFVPKQKIIIGSDTSCDLIFPDLQPMHCRIYLSDQGYFAEDLGGGIKVNSVNGSGFVRTNDELDIGNRAIRIQIV